MYYFKKCGDNDSASLISSAMITGIFGLILLSASHDKSKREGRSEDLSSLDAKDPYIIVVFSWVLLAVFGMLPFLFYGAVNSIADAFFESMSGFTTSGSTILTNIDSQPHGLLLWRSMIHWIGGLGFILLFVAVMPVFNKGNNKMMLYSAESSNIGFRKLHPKMGVTARRLWYIYIIITVLCTLAYGLGPMNWFDAVCHAFSTVATGGFSTRQASIGYWNSPYLEYVSCFFMIFSGVSFTMYYFMFTGQLFEVRRNEEWKWYFGILFFFTASFVILFYIAPSTNIATDLASYPENTFEAKFRASLFHVSAMLSSTGFASSCCDYTAWGRLFWIPTLFVMAGGACSGSSSGGIKVVHEVICFKTLRMQFKRMLNPNAVMPVKMSKEVVESETQWKVMNYLFFYFTIIVMGTIALSLSGCNFEESIFNCVSAISNAGPAIGSTGPISTFADIPVAAKWIMSLLMLIGRLEIFTVIILFAPSFWKKK